MKKVSVIIPVYGAEKFIAATVQSVLDQTFKDFELLLIDDGSPDRSIEICQQFTDPRIRIIRQPNRGVSAARNNGIRQAQGKYLAFLDADDLWTSDKLAKQVQQLDDSPEVGVSFTYSAFIDDDGNPLGIYQTSQYQDITPGYILCRNPVGNGSTPLIRREALEAIKFQDNLYGTVEDFYFDDDRKLHPSEDVECWFRLAVKSPYKQEGIPEPLTLYRVNSGGFSAKLIKKLESYERLIEKTRIYAPEVLEQWGNPALAYQLRYLARRAVTLRDSDMAIQLIHRALQTHWQLLLEEPRRTSITLAAAYLLRLLPQSFYRQAEAMALKVTGENQKRQIVKQQSGQSA